MPDSDEFFFQVTTQLQYIEESEIKLLSVYFLYSTILCASINQSINLFAQNAFLVSFYTCELPFLILTLRMERSVWFRV